MSDDLIEKVAKALWETKSTADYPWWNIDVERCRLARALARAALAAIEASGTHVVVPVKPMPEMLGAWYRYKNGFVFAGDPPAKDTSDYGAYAAMLSARPPIGGEANG